jgi:hypothetical protein
MFYALLRLTFSSIIRKAALGTFSRLPILMVGISPRAAAS